MEVRQVHNSSKVGNNRRRKDEKENEETVGIFHESLTVHSRGQIVFWHLLVKKVLYLQKNKKEQH